MSIKDCKIIQLPKISDPRGNLTVVEGMKHIPFEIKRIFYLYDIPEGKSRGAHAHKQLHQFIIPIAGSFDVVVDDGNETATIKLANPWEGIHIPPMIWAEENNFLLGSVCMVLASDFYDETDYYRNYDEFIKAVKR